MNTVFIIVHSDPYETKDVYVFENKDDAEEMKRELVSGHELGRYGVEMFERRVAV